MMFAVNLIKTNSKATILFIFWPYIYFYIPFQVMFCKENTLTEDDYIRFNIIIFVWVYGLYLCAVI